MECPICTFAFAREKNIPKILRCGHTICEACLIKMKYSSILLKCAICNQLFKRKTSYCTNYTIYDILEDKLDSDLISKFKINDPKEINITVRNLSGITCLYKVKEDSTISELKNLIFKRDGILIQYQRLIWAGKELGNDNTLKFYKIYNGVCIHLVVRLLG